MSADFEYDVRLMLLQRLNFSGSLLQSRKPHRGNIVLSAVEIDDKNIQCADQVLGGKWIRKRIECGVVATLGLVVVSWLEIGARFILRYRHLRTFRDYRIRSDDTILRTHFHRLTLICRVKDLHL